MMKIPVNQEMTVYLFSRLEREINSEENTEKPEELVFPDSVHYEGQSASALSDTEQCIQPV